MVSRRVLVVTRSSRSPGPIGDPSSLSITDGTLAGRGAGVCGRFEPGQCTCLAYQKRSDVYDIAVAHGVLRAGRRAAGPNFFVWDGGQWLVNARRGGIPTGSRPVAGALVVWGVPNSASYGHVAYVERATSDTHVLISECNYDWHGHCRTTWRNPRAAAHLQGYIYGGPVGTDPPRPPPVGSRIGALLENGTLVVKQGALDAPWVPESGPNVKQVALSGDRIGALLENGTLVVKQGALDAPWVPESGPNVKQVALSGRPDRGAA